MKANIHSRPRDYPLKLAAAPVERIWGGRRIAETFNREIPLAHCGETWEVSTRAASPSRILNGTLSGMTLDKAWPVLSAPKPDRFPLLIKLLDAQDDLSVQVHPGCPVPSGSSGEPKTEMWYILDASPEACIFAGLKPDTTPAQFRKALQENRIADCLLRHPAKAGQAIFIPGGTVHAIGAGCLIYEVQQNSDTTYRVFDWNRKDSRGHQRELHVEPALRVIDWHATPPSPIDAPWTPFDPAVPPLIESPWFRFRHLRIGDGIPLAMEPGNSLAVLFVLEHAICIEQAERPPLLLKAGESALVPRADLAACRLTAVDPARPSDILLTTG